MVYMLPVPPMQATQNTRWTSDSDSDEEAQWPLGPRRPKGSQTGRNESSQGQRGTMDPHTKNLLTGNASFVGASRLPHRRIESSTSQSDVRASRRGKDDAVHERTHVVEKDGSQRGQVRENLSHVPIVPDGQCRQAPHSN